MTAPSGQPDPSREGGEFAATGEGPAGPAPRGDDSATKEAEGTMTSEFTPDLADEVAGASEAPIADGESPEASDLSDAQTDQVAELTEDLKRLSAEYTNYRRRVARDSQVAVTEAKAKVLTELLGIADELGMAAQHGDLETNEPLRKFNDKFFSVLGGQGVTEFGAVGDDFDPNLHEAVQDMSEGADPKIDTVLRKGYRVGDRVLRNAMVIVGA